MLCFLDDLINALDNGDRVYIIYLNCEKPSTFRPIYTTIESETNVEALGRDMKRLED